ncbi:stress responsive A/B barrel domain-containing protein [Tricharina praecox]|uniref:stress responsive A/B barrel domain-containing protein n=1 Tax=Tricharina praecox TaxID=43433 RepID=UPI00221FAF91|nr:stress responsive A/B barrel domain-containing protein [Tricharina praecox]KAI5856112.1 stress responsive A/B barrel domain-containing protein [Tricharina praecox]
MAPVEVPTEKPVTSVTHVVIFKLSDHFTTEEENRLITNFHSAKDVCRKPDGSQYILEVQGGRDVSPVKVPHHQGFTHGFVLKFASLEDRDYYYEQDPAHKKMKSGARAWFPEEDMVVIEVLNRD